MTLGLERLALLKLLNSKLPQGMMLFGAVQMTKSKLPSIACIVGLVALRIFYVVVAGQAWAKLGTLFISLPSDNHVLIWSPMRSEWSAQTFDVPDDVVHRSCKHFHTLLLAPCWPAQWATTPGTSRDLWLPNLYGIWRGWVVDLLEGCQMNPNDILLSIVNIAQRSGRWPGAYVFSCKTALFSTDPKKFAEDRCHQLLWKEPWSDFCVARVARGHTWCTLHPFKAVRTADQTCGKTARNLKYVIYVSMGEGHVVPATLISQYRQLCHCTPKVLVKGQVMFTVTWMKWMNVTCQCLAMHWIRVDSIFTNWYCPFWYTVVWYLLIFNAFQVVKAILRCLNICQGEFDPLGC